ncbi:SAF domain-containing protein [Demequina sp.]|uniref:SAF domain-containing protein n=1 Tax=Demequina sp. TaxID=2050685 RepID=UPI0025C4B4B1|nr:SAF domain-containing protein [Demequina sp.]
MSDTPVAGRLRRPGWRDPRLLVGLLLIAISVTAVTGIVRSSDTTMPYYAAKNALTPGTVLARDDVTVVQVRIPDGTYVEPGEEPWGQVVTRVVGDGELLPRAALADQGDFTGRPIAVRTSLPLADGVERGSLVDVYLTRTDSDEPQTTLVASGLVVESVDHESGSFSAGSVETVYVVVPRRDIEEFLDALASRGEISVVGLAGGAA